MKTSTRNFDRRVAKATTVTNQSRKGIAIVEVIVAMVLLAVAVASLASLIYSVSQSSLMATGNAYRNGVLMQEINRLEGVMKTVKIVITPTNLKFKPDTVSFTRTKARTSKALCTDCPQG